MQVDTNSIMQLISTLGFPIVMCGALFWKMNKNEDSNRSSNEKMAEDNRAINEKMTEAVNNNTIAITKLVTKLGADKEV